MALNVGSLILAAVFARLASCDIDTNVTLDLPPAVVEKAKTILHAECGEACVEVVVHQTSVHVFSKQRRRCWIASWAPGKFQSHRAIRAS